MASRWLFRLSGHSKQPGNELGLASVRSFVHPLYLPLPNHVHGLVPLQRAPGRCKRKEPESWLDETLEKAVVLFDDVVEIFHLPQFTAEWKDTLGFHLTQGFGIGGVFVDGNHAGDHRMSGLQRLLKKLLGGLSVARGAQ